MKNTILDLTTTLRLIAEFRALELEGAAANHLNDEEFRALVGAVDEASAYAHGGQYHRALQHLYRTSPILPG